MTGEVFIARSSEIKPAVQSLLASAELVSRLGEKGQVLLKPNLVEARRPPITTPVELVEEVVIWLREKRPDLTIWIAEGTGSIYYPTQHCFDSLGYTLMAKKRDVQLLDLNLATLVRKDKPAYSRLPSVYLPEILDHCFIISLPVLKAHSLAGVSLTMKNMMGCLPPAKYREGNSWGKSAFHRQLQRAIFELNRYRAPDFTVLDASIGMAEAHLWGAHCDPPVGKIVAGYDPLAVDSFGTHLLGKNWREIEHLVLADGVLGSSWQKENLLE